MVFHLHKEYTSRIKKIKDFEEEMAFPIFAGQPTS
jgi:hypothetical protein